MSLEQMLQTVYVVARSWWWALMQRVTRLKITSNVWRHCCRTKAFLAKTKFVSFYSTFCRKEVILCFATAADYLVYNWLSIIDDVQSPLCVTCITVTITEPPPASSTAWADMQLVPNPLPSQKLSFRAVSTFQGLRGEWRLWCAFQRCYTWFHTLRETDPPTLLHKLASWLIYSE